jgi:hypothetical protein
MNDLSVQQYMDNAHQQFAFIDQQYAQPHHSGHSIASDMLMAGAAAYLIGDFFNRRQASKQQLATIQQRYQVPMASPLDVAIRQRTGRWHPQIPVDQLHAVRNVFLYALEYANQHEGLAVSDDGTDVPAGAIIYTLRALDDDIAVTGATAWN